MQLRKKQTNKEVKAKQQRSHNIAASTLGASQHADRQPAIPSAFSTVSTGDADEGTASLFYGADIQHTIVNSQLWKDVAKVFQAVPASYAGPNSDRLGNELLLKLDEKTAVSRAVSKYTNARGSARLPQKNRFVK